MAAFLHQRSERTGPLVAVNCAALPESLLESELFGIEGGVATGVRARLGRFELAEGGTLFLDEVADLDVALQVKLLRALQEREIVRVGGQRAIAVDARVVAATHQPLERLVEEGRFREDLYYRLKGISVELPPLRERRRDIPHLIRHFAERFCERESVELPQFDRTALNFLLAHDYPGNVRELQNIVEGAVSLADGVVDVALIQSLIGRRGRPSEPGAARPRDGQATSRTPGDRDDGGQQERRREASRRQQAHPDARKVLTGPLSVRRPSGRHPAMIPGHSYPLWGILSLVPVATGVTSHERSPEAR